MSGHSQRGKGKPVSRVRSQKMQSSGANFAKGCHGQAGGNQGDEELGIFANMEMAYALGRYVIGNIVEVTTNENEKLLGVVKAISQDGDVGLVHAYSPQKGKNGRVSVDAMLVNYSNWRMLRIQNVRPNDCLLDEIKIDSEIANECDLPVANATDKQLVPFFDSSEPIKDCLLDQGGFPADEMFKTNKELFSVRTTFNPDLREYTTPVDRTAPNYQETEARCAKLAQDIEQSESTLTNMENALENDDDEEEKYSAVSRSAKDHPGNTARLSIRSSRSAHDRPSSRLEVVNVSRQLANVSVHSKGVTNVSSETNQPVVEANSAKSPVPSAPIQDTLNKAPSQPDLSEKPSAVEVTETVKPKVTSESSEPPPSSVVTSVTEEKVKKSTLDPNAPEFKPLSLQYATAHPPVVPQQSVPGVTYATHAPQNSLNPAPTIQLPMQPMSAFVAGAQTPLYVPSSVSYASQAGQLQQLMSGVVSASIPSNIQHVRGGSLPPNLQQPPFNSPVNSGANILMQHPQQPGLSVAQMITSQPVIVAGPNPGRFSGPPSSMSLTRQRSNESSAGQQSSLYCPSQPSVSIPAFQPSVYQFSQPGTIPFLVPPQMGLHFLPAGVPGIPTSSALMVSGVPLPQASGQQAYPPHTMLHMQPAHLQMPTMQSEQAPPPSTTPQQAQAQQAYPQNLTQFQEHPHHIQLQPYGQNLMFASQPNPANYYATPAMLTGQGTVNPSVPASLLPIVNHTSQHSVGGNPGHAQIQLDQAFVNAHQLQQSHQFNPTNCQPPHLLQSYPAAAQQFLQSQQLTTIQHVNSQHMPPNPYQAFATIVPSGANSSQAH